VRSSTLPARAGERLPALSSPAREEARFPPAPRTRDTGRERLGRLSKHRGWYPPCFPKPSCPYRRRHTGLQRSILTLQAYRYCRPEPSPLISSCHGGSTWRRQWRPSLAEVEPGRAVSEACRRCGHGQGRNMSPQKCRVYRMLLAWLAGVFGELRNSRSSPTARSHGGLVSATSRRGSLLDTSPGIRHRSAVSSFIRRTPESAWFKPSTSQHS